MSMTVCIYRYIHVTAMCYWPNTTGMIRLQITDRVKFSKQNEEKLHFQKIFWPQTAPFHPYAGDGLLRCAAGCSRAHGNAPVTPHAVLLDPRPQVSRASVSVCQSRHGSWHWCHPLLQHSGTTSAFYQRVYRSLVKDSSLLWHCHLRLRGHWVGMWMQAKPVVAETIKLC